LAPNIQKSIQSIKFGNNPDESAERARMSYAIRMPSTEQNEKSNQKRKTRKMSDTLLLSCYLRRVLMSVLLSQPLQAASLQQVRSDPIVSKEICPSWLSFSTRRKEYRNDIDNTEAKTVSI